MNKKIAITVASIFWLAMGSFLLVRGLKLINLAASQEIKGGLFLFFEGYVQAPLMLLFLGMCIGFAKAQMVFRKQVKKNVDRLEQMEKIPFFQIFPKATWIVIGGMMMLGFLLRMLPLPLDVRSVILVAIGSALIQGAVFYLRALVEPKSSLSL